MTKRNEFLDIVKFVAIFLVLWGHVVQQSYSVGKIDSNASLDSIYCVIYTVHMPLFMGLCGYFFSLSMDKVGQYRKSYIKRRVKSLIIPMISFGLIKFFIDICLKNKDISIILYLKDVKEIWFLGDLAVNTVIIYFLISKLSGNLRKDWKWLIIGMLFSILPYTGQGVYMYIFFVLGFYVKQYINIIQIYFFNFRYVIYAIIMYLTMYKVYVFLGIYAFHINIFKYDEFLSLFITDILKILLGIFSSLINKLKEYGKYTLELYLLNIIILEYVLGGIVYSWIVKQYDYNIIQDNGFIFELISTFIITLIVMKILLFIINKIYKYPKISKILFYKVIK